ncbi:MAG: ribosome-associated translation inhibitor RaiA [Phycisphaeraceae bacterium]
MQITVSGKHIEMTPAIKQYAMEKVAKLPRYYDRIQEIDVVAGKIDNARTYEVEVIVKVERSDPFVAKTSGSDLYACVDETVDKLERQLTDHKGKLRNRKHNVS